MSLRIKAGLRADVHGVKAGLTALEFQLAALRQRLAGIIRRPA